MGAQFTEDAQLVARKTCGGESRPRYLPVARNGIIHCTNQILDESETTEPPETPAPVFAARALKSALFGTPAPPEDEAFYEGESESENMVVQDTVKGMSRSLSPTKPPGILLTPGTGTTRRKTVSFGNEVIDKTEERQTNGTVTSRSGIPDDCPGKFPSPWNARSKSSTRAKRKTSLTKVLENAREGKTPKVESGSSAATSEPQQPAISKPDSDIKSSPSKARKPRKSSQSNQELLQQLNVHEGFDGDMTVDLNEPHSQSGKFWKSSFEQYHEEAKAEMAKLLKYKQLAKSYAKLKDVQSINLEEKLKEEQRKVVCMEDKISRLQSQIAMADLEGNDDESPELMKELARQTALAEQYKGQVEEFRLALEGPKGQSNISANEGKRLTSPRTEKTLLETHRELKKAREQLKEMISLREEMQTLRQTLSTTEKTVTKLQEENTKLTQELLHADLRLETHLEKCERKRKSSEERLHRRDEELQALQKDYGALKDLAKANRRDAEQLLKGRHDQVVKLRKEIASLRGAESTAQELQRVLQKKTADHETTVADLQIQIEALKESQKQESVDDRVSKRTKDERLNMRPDPYSKPLPSIESHVRESQIEVYSPPISRPSKALAPSNNSRSDTPSKSPRPRSSHSALSEIVNGASDDSVPAPRYGPVQHTPLPAQVTPLTTRFSSMSLESPEMQLPSPEPSLPQITSRAIHERNCRASPRPSMFNIASSPPKAAVVRSQTSGELTRQRSNNNLAARRLANLSSSRSSTLDGSKPRVALPPERAAAARARLEQKNAEKKRAQALGGDKENIQN